MSNIIGCIPENIYLNIIEKICIIVTIVLLTKKEITFYQFVFFTIFSNYFSLYIKYILVNIKNVSLFIFILLPVPRAFLAEMKNNL